MSRPGRECLYCGMRLERAAARCPKCDADLNAQHDGSTWSIDIAHHGERVDDALAKLHQALADVRYEPARDLRLVVGTGRIRDAVLGELAFLERRGDILRFETEPGNRGALLIRVKRG